LSRVICGKEKSLIIRPRPPLLGENGGGIKVEEDGGGAQNKLFTGNDCLKTI